MRTIAVTNEKGGTGKTTTAVNLAAALGTLGQRVVVIDLDHQGWATKWLGHSPLGTELAEVFTHGRRLDDIVQPTTLPGVELVPGCRALAGADRELSAPELDTQAALREALAAMAPRDVVLIDCPPSLGLLVITALAAAQEVLVPVAIGAMEIEGLADLLRTIDTVQRRLNPALRIAAVLACRVPGGRSRIADDVLAALTARFPDVLLSTVIHESTRFREAPSHQQTIGTYDPGGRGAQDYLAAAHELLDRKEPCHA